MTIHASDAIVIGGGVVGLAVGRALGRAGLRVVVFERNPQPGGEASWAAAGMLAPQSEADAPGPMLDLCLAGRATYPDFAAALREETGIDIELRREGTLRPAFSDRELDALKRISAWQRAVGLSAEVIDAATALALEPKLSPRLAGALRLPDDWQVDNRRLTKALIVAAHRAGVEIRCNADGIGLSVENGRVRGVKVGLDEWSAPVVVNAAGSWAARMPAELLRLPKASVRPIRGQMLALDMQPPTLLSHVVRTETTYLVPRRDGRLVVGATVEDAGYSKAVTAGGVAALLGGAVEVVPALADAPLLETWAGLRPLAEDHLPILGRADIDGLICATGHYRNGILLTPITGDIVKALVLDESSPIDLDPFSPLRFRTQP